MAEETISAQKTESGTPKPQISGKPQTPGKPEISDKHKKTKPPSFFRRPFWWGLTLALIIILADQASKFWILEHIRLDERMKIELTPFFDLTMVWNYGVSFGLLQADSWVGRALLSLFALLVTGFLGVWMARTPHMKLALVLGLVTGGALGNVIDRLRFGAVVDFLDFSGLWFPWVFNIADAAISLGAAFLFFLFLFDKKIFSEQKTGA